MHIIHLSKIEEGIEMVCIADKVITSLEIRPSTSLNSDYVFYVSLPGKDGSQYNIHFDKADLAVLQLEVV